MSTKYLVTMKLAVEAVDMDESELRAVIGQFVAEMLHDDNDVEGSNPFSVRDSAVVFMRQDDTPELSIREQLNGEV